jgi:hypothetical protein
MGKASLLLLKALRPLLDPEDFPLLNEARIERGGSTISERSIPKWLRV